ncbi:MAG: type III-A CRISPR-associated RAMP protein Csm5 [Proteobacteria bacterium]|nr:type III-A CRISPR-associated RAMP protein Csm5 [Pseudomonadota bacterium]
MSRQETIVVEKRLRIETLSALHIGTGVQLGSKEYARHRQQIFVAKPGRVLALAQRSPQMESAFLGFCEDERQTLTDFLQEQRIPLENITDYHVMATAEVARRIPIFIKTAEGKPYLPGSSLKGAVRSALFRSRIKADNAVLSAAGRVANDDLNEIRHQKNPNLSRWRKRIGSDVERTFFGKDEHHDFMRCLQFSDSSSREPTELRIVEVRVLSLSSNGDLHPARDPRRDDRDMRPVTPEVIPKGVQVVSHFTINHYLLSDTQPANELGFRGKKEFIKVWLAECNRAAQDHIQQEIDFFKRHPLDGKRRMAQWYEALKEQLQQAEKTGNQCLLHLAWGSGWDTKTITDQFDDKLFDDVRRTLRLNVGRPHLPMKGRPAWGSILLTKDDSPKSRKVVFENGQPQEPLGWVKVSLEEVMD